ncbi:hypothetical protein [Sphingobacterium cavernae]|uniref:hypothetical protein n=1 Tax=Sphingobacterium cavernae TaxID=2592657 RepID=UPI00123001A7|nr:hypothetical protein [Sphingobacterium cavernae]
MKKGTKITNKPYPFNPDEDHNLAPKNRIAYIMTKEIRILFIAVSINLFIAFFLFYLLPGNDLADVFDFINNFGLNLFVGITGLYAFAYYCGLRLN